MSSIEPAAQADRGRSGEPLPAARGAAWTDPRRFGRSGFHRPDGACGALARASAGACRRVDHGLRPEAAAEARSVAENAAELGLAVADHEGTGARRWRQSPGLGAARALSPPCHGSNGGRFRHDRDRAPRGRPGRDVSPAARAWLRRLWPRGDAGGGSRRRDHAVAAAPRRPTRSASRDRRRKRAFDRR